MNSTKIALAICLLCLSPITLWAQKEINESTGIFESRAEYSQFMGQAKRLAYGPEGSVELQSMIPILNDIVLQRPIGETGQRYGVSTRSNLGLLSDPQIREEIELVDDQMKRLNSVNQQLQKQMGAELRSLDFSDADAMARRIRSIREKMNQQLEDVLLPHQVERLKQLAFRSMLTRRSFVDVLTSDPFRTDLKISADQAEELQKATEEINAEMRKKILKLQEEGRKKLISRLKPDQAEKVNDLIGDAFQFTPADDKREKERKQKRFKNIRNAEKKKE